jgi:CheY-like chemotaxis protein
MITILVLDDSLNWRENAERILKKNPSFKAICPSDVVSGINNDLNAYMAKVIEDDKPDVILTDIMFGHTPKLMDAGFKIARFMKQYYPSIPVIGMSSGFVSEEDTQACGMSRFVFKAHLETLIPLINELVGA